MESNKSYRILIYQILKDRFNLREINDIAYDLGTNPDNLEGNTLYPKAQALVDYQANRGRLKELAEEVIRRRPDTKEELANNADIIPFVVAAMTEAEANELISESIFQNVPLVDGLRIPMRGEDYEKRLFQGIVEELPDNVFAKYGLNRDDWKPYSDKGVREIIENVAEQMTYRPLFFSEALFSDNLEERRTAAYQLQRSGCILIIDAVSLYHPKVEFLLSNSGLLTNRPSVVTLVLSPFDHTGHSLNQYFESFFRQSHSLSVILSRFERSDIFCEFGIGGIRPFKRWLHSILPRAVDIVNTEKAHRENIERFQDGMGMSVGSGIQDKIFGGR